GVPMLPVVEGDRATRRQIFIYSVLLALSGVAPFIVNTGGLVYLTVSVALGARFVWHGWRVLQADKADNQPAIKLFKFSIFYLFALFATLLLERLAGLHG
ncbi:MAG: UbiA family prenyltransferase, partial [Hyphococcus sp.]